jgi:EAL domain-containing protein (putative c-di-GMP-specific phosphodiesterase class I)
MVVVDGADESVALELAGRIGEVIRQPYATRAGTALLSAGAGIARSFGPAWLSPTEVLMRADLALREAKQSGRGELVVFDQKLHDRQFEQMRIQGELRAALEREGLQLHFQPIVNISSGEPVGVEALLRWFPPGRPPVPPSVFIPAAEQSELIVDIDNWVVEQACRCLGSWQADPALTGLRMSVNVSGRHLSSTDLVGSVRRALEKTSANPELLIIEATETELIPNLDQAVNVLERLKDLGVTLAIDDFGTGYASVAHIRRVSFGELKIDRTFIANLESDTDRSIADLLVSLGRDLNLDVVAEGIETPDQLAWARTAGCTHAQGYLLARPGPEDVLRDNIDRMRSAFTTA